MLLTRRAMRLQFPPLASLAVLLAAGCDVEATRTLDEEDGGIEVFDLPASDGGPRDADPTDVLDAGPLDIGLGPLCVGEARVWLSPELPLGVDSYEGPVSWLPTGALRIGGGDPPVSVVFGSGVLPEGLHRHREFYGRIESYRPFWEEVRLTLWSLRSTGRRGRLLFVGWTGSSYGEGTYGDELTYRYEASTCRPGHDECGSAHGMDLVVEGEAVGYGERRSVGHLEVVNGRSSRYYREPTCTDTPRSWYEGWIWLGDAPCGQLQRDDCIADPRCVLWGSEIRDPEYACVEASGACESILVPSACRNQNCRWDPGDCYCPEGIDCACGGGPAPKCRSVCGGQAGVSCPDDRYCEWSSLDAPACVLPPDAEGWCERPPPYCRGTPPSEVCACGPDGPTRYGNDCSRRMDQAGPADPAACPP